VQATAASNVRKQYQPLIDSARNLCRTIVNEGLILDPASFNNLTNLIIEVTKHGSEISGQKECRRSAEG
jgi:hypothetical protein